MRQFPIVKELEAYIFGWLQELTRQWLWVEDGTMDYDEVLQHIEEMLRGYGPMAIASISAYAGTLPDNVLLCDGSSYLRVDYPDLYAVLDSDLIIDADNFNVPDLRGRAIIGSGQGSGLSNRATGAQLGAETHQLTQAEMPSHVHSVHAHGTAINVEEPIPGAPYPISTPNIIGGTTGSTGGDGSHNNMQPSEARKWGIVAW